MNKEYFKEQLQLYKKNGLSLSDMFSSDRVFFRSNHEEITFVEFWQECLILINSLSSKVQDHQRVALSVSDSKYYLKLIFSLWALGKSTVLLSSKMPDSEISNKMEQTKTSLLMDDDFLNNLVESKSSFVEKSISIHSESLIVFTSGSSGGSKGVRLSLKNLLASALGTIHAYKLNQDDSWLLSLPLHHVGGLLIPIRTALVKASIINSNPGNLLLDIENFSPSFMSLVSTQLQRLVNTPNMLNHLKTAKAIILGGGPCGESLLKQCESHQLKMANSYGQTETAAQVCSTSLTSKFEDLKSVGKPLLFRKIEIINNNIEVSGDTVSLGYINNGVEENFTDNKILTTDMAKYDESNNLIIQGRSDQIFMSGGENINPNEIELIIKQYKGIQDAIVVPTKNSEFGLVPYAFISYIDDIDTDDLKRFIKSKTSSFKCPKAFFNLDHLSDIDPSISIKYKRSDLKSYANKLYNDPKSKFHSSKRGNITGEIVVFLHGFMGCAKDFKQVVNNLEDKYFCVSIDLPGHGLTPSSNFKDLDDLLKELTKEVSRLGKDINLLGYSQGGRIAFGLALKDPSLYKSLIIESSNPGIENLEERAKRFNHDQRLLLDVNTPEQIHTFLKTWYQAKLFANISSNKNYIDLLNSKSQENPEEWRKSLTYLSVGNQPNYWPLLNSLKDQMSCHIITGQKDIKYGDIANRLCKDANFDGHTIENCGHNTHFEMTLAFSNIISKIISSI